MECWLMCLPRVITYTRTPRYGSTITKMIHKALAIPDMSWLRKTSENTRINSVIQMKKQKNHSMDQNTSPVPKVDSAVKKGDKRGCSRWGGRTGHRRAREPIHRLDGGRPSTAPS